MKGQRIAALGCPHPRGSLTGQGDLLRVAKQETDLSPRSKNALRGRARVTLAPRTDSLVRCSGGVHSGSKPAVIRALASGLLYFSHPTLAGRVSTSRSCHLRTHAPQRKKNSIRPPRRRVRAAW